MDYIIENNFLRLTIPYFIVAIYFYVKFKSNKLRKRKPKNELNFDLVHIRLLTSISNCFEVFLKSYRIVHHIFSLTWFVLFFHSHIIFEVTKLVIKA